MTTSAFWNTQFQQVRPSIRTVVSSEHTTRARRNRARIAATSLSNAVLARRNRPSSAVATMPGPNGEPASNPSGTGATVVPPQEGQHPA